MIAHQLDTVFRKFPDARREHLIPILQEVQAECGFLSKESMTEIGRRLHLPASKVYGVATFYNQFRFAPLGKVHIQVCRGTACHVKASAAVLDALQRTLKVEPGETSRDGMFSLETVACIGACGLAPVIAVNGEFHACVTPDGVRKIVVSYTKGAKANAEVAHETVE